MSFEELKLELKDVWDSEESALRCGGTYSSWSLRKCLDLKKKIDNFAAHDDYDRFNSKLEIITERWRRALARHNSQNLKVQEYDLETGLPFTGPAMEPIKLKKPEEKPKL